MPLLRTMEYICGRSGTQGSSCSQARGSRHRVRAVRRPNVWTEIESNEEQRIDMLDEELNRVLGGGLVQGSLTLIGGEPGIRKIDSDTPDGVAAYPQKNSLRIR